jgi:hypothetical protein
MLCYAPPRALWRASAGWDMAHAGWMRRSECVSEGRGAASTLRCTAAAIAACSADAAALPFSLRTLSLPLLLKNSDWISADGSALAVVA